MNDCMENEIKNNLNYFRGIMAIVVLLSHLWFFTGYAFLIIFNKVVTIAVSYFFFVSAYSIAYNQKYQEKYLSKIVKRKIPKLVIYAIGIYCFSAILEYIELGRTFKMYIPFSIEKMIQRTNWYIYEMLLFYIAFALIYSILKSRKWRCVGILLFSMLIFIIFRKAGLSEAWSSSVFGFFLGIITFEFKAYKLKNKISICGIAIMLAFSLVLGFLTIRLDSSYLITALLRNIVADILLIFLFLLVIHVKIPKNKLQEKLNAMSADIYFIHIPVFDILNEKYSGETFTLIALGYTFVIVLLLGYGKWGLHKYWANRRKNDE